MDIAVIVGTFGDDHWAELARERAIPSAEAEGVEVVHHHGKRLDSYGASLAECRNQAIAQTEAEWIVTLDADDELRPGFIKAIAGARGDLRTPMVEYVRAGRIRPPMFWPERPLTEGNWLVVCTALRREMFWQVGGFRDVPMYEDWDLFQRCVKAGAVIEKVPGAVCRVHINLGSLHRNGSNRAVKRAAHRHILELNHPELV